MQGMIDKQGYLLIARKWGDKGGLIRMYCPYNIPEEKFCGDWCALFGELVTYKDHAMNTIEMIELCHRTLYFDEFTDER